MFARRPAPIQVNYLGFPGTLGAAYLDYIIADRHVMPAAHRPFYTEKVVMLPNCYQANDRNKAIAERIFSRADCGLPADGHGVLLFQQRLQDHARHLRLLDADPDRVEGSVLWLLEDTPVAAANLRREAAARGVDAEPHRLRATPAAAGASGAAPLRRSVSGYAALQRPHHRERRAVGRLAAADLSRRNVRGPGVRQSARQPAHAGTDHDQSRKTISGWPSSWRPIRRSARRSGKSSPTTA